jgi:hypothetical protein
VYGLSQDAIDGMGFERSVRLTVSLSLNDTRALRIAELVNDYRTLLVHIMELISSISLDTICQSSYKTIIQCHAAAQRLLAGTYDLSKFPSLGGNPQGEDAETMDLRE